jgi:exopolyphosphatase/guanosine-5'-triphosphate,3'-diphosphate pyrophosphatase
MKIAVIDLGSNAARLLLVKITESSEFQQEFYLREKISLGEESFKKLPIGQKNTEKLLKIFKKFKKIIEERNISNIKAIATSALRDAPNSSEIIALIFRETGIMIEPIMGDFEAELVAKAVIYKNPKFNGAIIDLGGGSMEIILVENQRIHEKRSFQIGNNRIFKNLEENTTNLEKLEHFEVQFSSFLPQLKMFFEKYSIENIALTGGNSRYLAEILGKNSLFEDAKEISFSDFIKKFEQFKTLSQTELQTQENLRYDQSKTLISSMFVFSKLITMLNLDKFFVPNTGLREGIALYTAKLI